MTINEKQPGDCGYVAFFEGDKVGLYASSLYQAKLRALSYFKPSKRKTNLVSVILAERADGTEVTHTPDF